MFLIGDTLVSLDVIEKKFCCDLGMCHGSCCIKGDAGAPIREEEIEIIKSILPKLLPDMTPEARDVLERKGLSYFDQTGERVLTIVENTCAEEDSSGDDAPCIFARTGHDGCCYCIIEKAYNAGKIDFRKPISCHLYPIRLTKIGENKHLTGVEYHRWDICHCARQLGRKEHIALYKYLKEPLIRAFGETWYNELKLTATEWKKQMSK